MTRQIECLKITTFYHWVDKKCFLGTRCLYCQARPAASSDNNNNCSAVKSEFFMYHVIRVGGIDFLYVSVVCFLSLVNELNIVFVSPFQPLTVILPWPKFELSTRKSNAYRAAPLLTTCLKKTLQTSPKRRMKKSLFDAPLQKFLFPIIFLIMMIAVSVVGG